MFDGELGTQLLLQVLGAAIAGTVGVVTALFLDWSRDRRHHKIQRRLLMLDLDRIIQQLNSVQWILSDDEHDLTGAPLLTPLPTLSGWEAMRQSRTAGKLPVEDLDRLQNFLVHLNDLQVQCSEKKNEALGAVWWKMIEGGVEEYKTLAQRVRREL